MELRVIGRYKGKITLDPDEATVLDLKQAVSRQSGLAIPELKLLAGGKHLKDDTLTLSQCGINPSKPIMVLRQELSDRVQAEEGLHRRTEEVAQAASALSALAARDIGLGTGGRGNSRGGGERGGQNNARRGGGMGLAGVPIGAPKIELTNQHGEAMSIPAEDSAALMEGMMLHRSALACVAHTRQSAAPALGKKQQFPVTAAAEEKKGKGREEEFLNDASPLKAGTDPESSTQRGREESKGLAPEDGGQEERKGNADGNDAQGGIGASSGSLGNVEPKQKGKGKGKMRLAPARRSDEDRRLPPAAEKRLAQREALGLLFKAEEAFRRCDPKYLESVDNYAYLCLDIVWLLFLMKDMSNLDLASRMLVSVEKGFQKAHGPGLQRLTALKGEFCAEKLLYVRLHLLQGVLAFLQGDSGKASGLLIRAREEAKALKPDPVLAVKLIRKWRTLKMEDLRPKVALLALRTGRNNLDAAWHYLEAVRQREETARKEMGERMAKQKRERRFGLTSDKKSFVDAALVAQLTDGGFSRGKVIRALRKHNNDIEATLSFLTTTQAREASSGSKDEALAIMQSLGVPQEAARDALEKTGVLCDALQELGINAPEGMMPPQRIQMNDGGIGAAVDGGLIDDTDSGNSSEDVVWKATEEEARLLVELAADKKDQEEGEGYLDISLEDEADAADMYLHLCRGKIPLTFDLDKVRAGIAAASEEVKHAGDGGGGK